MFTGIINDLGRLRQKETTIFTFLSKKEFLAKVKKGASIAVNGVCLTALKDSSLQSFSVEVMPETIERTTLGKLRWNDLVNLELPITPNSFLSGHIVQGHVDGVGKIISIAQKRNSKILTISVPQKVNRYIVAKGSITIDGISLTIISANQTSFKVGIIPYTWTNTNLQNSRIGSLVNIETDIIAKYIEKQIKHMT